VLLCCPRVERILDDVDKVEMYMEKCGEVLRADMYV